MTMPIFSTKEIKDYVDRRLSLASDIAVCRSSIERMDALARELRFQFAKIVLTDDDRDAIAKWRPTLG
jgi:hypothetical protein